MTKRLKGAVVVLGLGLVVTGCAARTPAELTIYGAASLTASLEEIKPAYALLHPETKLAASTGSSAALRTQIEQGAPADVFLSADVTNAQMLADAGKTDGAVEPFAKNALTIIVPRGNPGAIASPLDLARSNVRVVAGGEEVPITRYAKQAVANLADRDGYPANYVAAYESNIVSREENVGAIVAKVAFGEGDAAIAYVTDALGANVETVEIPSDANVIATYGGVVLRGARAASGHAFLDWLTGPDGQQILARHGFLSAS